MWHACRLVVLLAVCALSFPVRGQQPPTPRPTDPLVNRTYCAADLGNGRIAAGATFGVLFYQLPGSGGTPGDPRRLTPEDTRLLLPDSVNDLALAGDQLLVANGPAGLKMVRGIAAEETPEVSFQLPLPGAAVGLAVAEPYVAVAMGVMGVALLDLSVPDAPTVIGTFDTDGYARQVRFSRASPDGTVTLVVANSRSGVATLTIDSGSGKLLSSDAMRVQGDVRQVVELPDGLVVSQGTKGVCFFPRAATPSPIHCYHSQDTVRGMAATRSHLLAGDGGAGLMVIAQLEKWGTAQPVTFRYENGSLNRVYHFGKTIVLAADYYGILVFPTARLDEITGAPSQIAPEDSAETH